MQDIERNKIVWLITKSGIDVVKEAAKILSDHIGDDRVLAEGILKRHLTEKQIQDAWVAGKSIPGSIQADFLTDEFVVRPCPCPEGKSKAAILRCSLNVQKQDRCPHCGQRSGKI